MSSRQTSSDLQSRNANQRLQSSNTHQRLQSSNANQACVASQCVSRWPATTAQPLSGNLHPSGADTSGKTSDAGQTSSASDAFYTSDASPARDALDASDTGVASDALHASRACHTSNAGVACHASNAASPMSGNSPGQNPEALLPTKMCTDCCRLLPLTDFRFRNRAAGTRMCQCNRCHVERNREREQIKRARKAGWDIHKTASQIAKSRNLTRSLWLLDQLVDAMGGPQNLVDRWREECWKLTRQKRSSTRLSRMYEMLIAMACQTRGMPWKD